jgi:hypothetical protein
MLDGILINREKIKKNWKNHALFSVMRNERKKQNRACLYFMKKKQRGWEGEGGGNTVSCSNQNQYKPTA